MSRNPRPAPPAAGIPEEVPAAAAPDSVEAAGTPGTPGASGAPGTPGETPSLAGLGIAGISRRRVAWAGLALAAAWIVVGLAGQAADAARAASRVGDEQALNAAVMAETEALREELRLVTQERWVLQQARAYLLGSRKERPFALEPGVPELAEDAPGSAARRLGADEVDRTPLEAWLEILFGPSR